MSGAQVARILRQEEQTHTLFCDVCGKDAVQLIELPDPQTESLNACLNCYLKECDVAS